MEQIIKPRKSSIIAAAIIAAMAILLVSTFVFWQNIAAQVKFFAQTALTEQIKSYVNGEVVVEKIDFTLAGQIRLTGVTVYGGDGSLLAKIPIARVYYKYNLFDFTDRKINFRNLARIESIFLQKCEIFIREENEKINWNPILQTKKSDGNAFEGKVRLGAAKINLESEFFSNAIDEINGEFDFKEPGNVTIDLAGNVGKTLLAVKGIYLQKEGRIFLYSVEPIDFAQFDLVKIFPKFSGIPLKEGVLQKIVLVCARDLENNWRFETEGEFSGLSLSGPFNATQGYGKFAGSGGKIEFRDLSFAAFGHQAMGQGVIFLKNEVAEKPSVDFSFALPSVDISSISPNLSGEQRASINILLTGLLQEPDVTGDFNIPVLNLMNVFFNNVSGEFYNSDDHRLILKNIVGHGLGGKITANGDIFFDNRTCELDIAGEKMDSSSFLGKDVQGTLAFGGHLSSRNKDIIIKGNFVIRDGRIYDVPFQLFNGYFVKKDETYDISDIAIRTRFGTLYCDELSKDALSKLRDELL